MKSAARLLACFLVVSCLLLVGLVLCPSWSSELGLDVWTLPVIIEHENRREEQLDAEWQDVLQRIDAKSDIVLDLIDGDLSLQETIVRFREVDRQYPLAVVEESTCERVVAWAMSRACFLAPELRAELRVRLEAEADALLSSG